MRALERSRKFYVDGQWVKPFGTDTFELIDPNTETGFATLAMGNHHDVDRAVDAASRAFKTYSQWSPQDRRALLQRILDIYNSRIEEFSQAMRLEMGAPITFSRNGQSARGPAHLQALIDTLDTFDFETPLGTSLICHEPIGVCGLITPWNWPVNQMVVKVAPALAAGCTMILKPSEYSPLSALLFAEVLDDAGVPPGVFNLVNGEGPTVGAALATHDQIDMVSFTGSTRAGISVAQDAAATVKRVAQELGGKSANLLLDDADFETAVTRGVAACFTNAGQSCSIPTRMLVPASRMKEAADIAARAAATYRVGPSLEESTQIGPVVNRRQFDRVQQLIQAGIDEGARLVAGGTGKPSGLEHGYFVRPTVFADVNADMRIAREEIFGPVLSIMPYDDEDDAVAIANNSEYGLAAYVQSRDQERARRVARKLRAGSVHINYPPADFAAPFGGYKRSGNGREWGEFGLREYLETKAIVGYQHI